MDAFEYGHYGEALQSSVGINQANNEGLLFMDNSRKIPLRHGSAVVVANDDARYSYEAQRLKKLLRVNFSL